MTENKDLILETLIYLGQTQDNTSQTLTTQERVSWTTPSEVVLTLSINRSARTTIISVTYLISLSLCYSVKPMYLCIFTVKNVCQ